jgi:hypothetical protein
MNALHPEDRAMNDWRAALATWEPFETESRLRRADGEYRRFLLRFVPLRNQRGSVVEWYATSTDIEDLKRAEEELRRREARLRDAQIELAHANRVTATGLLAASIAQKSASRSPRRSPTPTQRGAGSAPSRPIWRRSGRPSAGSPGTADEPATSSAGFARSSGRRRRGTTGWTSTRRCSKSSR